MNTIETSLNEAIITTHTTPPAVTRPPTTPQTAVAWLGMLVVHHHRHVGPAEPFRLTICEGCGQIRPFAGDCEACGDPVF